MVVGAIGLFLGNGLANGCTPGPVTARSAGDRTTGAGDRAGATPTWSRTMPRPRRPTLGSGRAAPRALSGASARMTIDAALPADRALSETPQVAGARRCGRCDTGRMVRRGMRRWTLLARERHGRARSRSTELLVNPTGDDLGREWIELANRASEPLDLTQLHLATASTDVAAAAGTIAPGAPLLLGQSSQSDQERRRAGGGRLQQQADPAQRQRAALDLSGACAAGVVIDAAPGAHRATPTSARLDRRSRNQGALCRLGAVRDAGSFGTPGGPNPPCVENVDGGWRGRFCSRLRRRRGRRAHDRRRRIANLLVAAAGGAAPWRRRWPRRAPVAVRLLCERLGTVALSGAGGGAARAHGGEARRAQHADGLGQVAGGGGAPLQGPRRGKDALLHLAGQGVGQREVLRSLPAVRAGAGRDADRRRQHQPRRADHLLHRRDPGQHGAARRRRARRLRGDGRVSLLRRSRAGDGLADPAALPAADDVPLDVGDAGRSARHHRGAHGADQARGGGGARARAPGAAGVRLPRDAAARDDRRPGHGRTARRSTWSTSPSGAPPKRRKI